MMVLSHASGAATVVAFGLSGNYLAAISSRFIGGALNVTGGCALCTVPVTMLPVWLPQRCLQVHSGRQLRAVAPCLLPESAGCFVPANSALCS